MSLFFCLFVFVPIPYCFDYFGFVVYFETQEHNISSFFFLKIVLPVQGLLCFCTNFRIICSSSKKYVKNILIEIALNL